MKAKKNITPLLFVCTLLIGILLLSSCGNNLPDNSDGVNITLMVIDLDSTIKFEDTVKTTKSSLYDAFNEFAGISVQSTSSITGAYVNSVFSTETDASFSPVWKLENGYSGTDYYYIAVYHDIDELELKDLSGYSEVLVFDKNYYYSGVGVSLLPLHEGATYILKLAAY